MANTNKATSDLDRIIPPEITEDAFYRLIRDLAAKEDLRHVLEIGSSAGGGSTEAFVTGLAQNRNPAVKLFCVEVSRPRFEVLRATYADRPFVHCYNMSTVAPEEFPSESQIERFYHEEPSGLSRFPLPEVLRWLRQDIDYVRDAGVETDAIARIRADHGIDDFDMVLIDGSEFTGEVEFDKVIGAGIILMDDTHTHKCFNARRRILGDSRYEVIADDQMLRNGFAAFQLRSRGSRHKVGGGWLSQMQQAMGMMFRRSRN